MDVDPRTGLFSSSLDPQESTEGSEVIKKSRYREYSPGQKDFERRADRLSYVLPPASDVETAFRHGEWAGDREKVHAALVASCVPVARVERFSACGADCVVEFSPSLNKHRLRANYCKDRFCRPCSKRRSKHVQAEILDMARGKHLRFVTFTLKRSEKPLNFIISRLLTCFKKVRDHKFWKSAVRAGVAVVEVTRGKDASHWHVHLHVLVVGNFLDQKLLSEAWLKVTRDSKIVDVRAVRDAEVGVAYVAKYATKGWSQDVLDDPDALIECVLALRGRRLLVYFGEWYDRPSMLCKVEVGDWKRVATLGVIYDSALRGEEWAVAVFRSLGYAAGRVGNEPVFIGAGDVYSGP